MARVVSQHGVLGEGGIIVESDGLAQRGFDAGKDRQHDVPPPVSDLRHLVKDCTGPVITGSQDSLLLDSFSGGGGS